MKYLVQRFTPNPMLGVNGYMTMFECDSKESATSVMLQFKATASELSVFRVIALKEWKKEIKQAIN